MTYGDVTLFAFALLVLYGAVLSDRVARRIKKGGKL